MKLLSILLLIPSITFLNIHAANSEQNKNFPINLFVDLTFNDQSTRTVYICNLNKDFKNKTALVPHIELCDSCKENIKALDLSKKTPNLRLCEIVSHKKQKPEPLLVKPKDFQ